MYVAGSMVLPYDSLWAASTATEPEMRRLILPFNRSSRKPPNSGSAGCCGFELGGGFTSGPGCDEAPFDEGNTVSGDGLRGGAGRGGLASSLGGDRALGLYASRWSHRSNSERSPCCGCDVPAPYSWPNPPCGPGGGDRLVGGEADRGESAFDFGSDGVLGLYPPSHRSDPDQSPWYGCDVPAPYSWPNPPCDPGDSRFEGEAGRGGSASGFGGDRALGLYASH